MDALLTAISDRALFAADDTADLAWARRGSRVRVRPGREHDAMTKAAVGTVEQVASPALGIRFDGMPGLHRWYVAEELEQVAPPASAALHGSAAPEWAHLLPLGRIVGRDGRALTLADPQAVVATFAQGGIDLPVDYEHQNDKPEPGRTGPVPAAGWIKALEVRADGIWGRIEWTARARELLAAREYRYLSPVILHRKDGSVVGLKGAGLVHNPNLYLTALAAQEDTLPDPKSFLARLAVALGLAPEADEDAVISVVEALARKGVKPDPREYAPVAAMAELLRDRNEQLALMAEQVAQEKVEDAFRKGYLNTPMRDWALSLCRTDPAAFDTFMASAVPQFPHPSRGMPVRPALATMGARCESDEEAALCRQLGLAPGSLSA